MGTTHRYGTAAGGNRTRWLAAACVAAVSTASLSGCSLLGEWDEPFTYHEVVIPESVAEPGSRFEYQETALLPLEDGREVAVTFTTLSIGGPENAGLAEIGDEWTHPESVNIEVGMQGDAHDGTSALPPDLVGILDDGSVAPRATVDEAPEAIVCEEALGVPKQDEADSQQLRCALYLVPPGRALVELQWGPPGAAAAYAEDPVVWRVPSMAELMAGETAGLPSPTS
ncbi:hypothetical protein [Pseudoclavibacter terrae]|uniref:Uncharacterized protein n=1 Tax=Pseudoclavibacter terrae TaxID=1530195 RepID=A0A7J5B5Z9_9MICO|nr:hypothetical protein [Pseudoclavibacter terrae]KAB1639596.1 hypothetical protein F8O03_04510 [Pseudoclavibacter terrae]